MVTAVEGTSAMWKLGTGLKPGPFVKRIGFQTGILIVTIKAPRAAVLPFNALAPWLGLVCAECPGTGKLQVGHVTPIPVAPRPCGLGGWGCSLLTWE